MSFNQKPFLISAQSKFRLAGEDYIVYLDINTRSRLEGMYFECPSESEWFEYFNSLALELERVSLKDIPKVVSFWKATTCGQLHSKLFNLPLSLLNQALDTYYGRSLGHSEISSMPSEELLCRCFGVYKQQVADIIKEKPSANLIDISNSLKASIGCGKCSESVVKFIDSCCAKLTLEKSGVADLSAEFDEFSQRIRPLGMAPSEFVLKIDSLMKKWIKEQELSRIHMEIVSIKGHCLDFEIRGTDSGKYILETFCEYIQDKLGLSVRFNLLL
ncbi:(2Fe-2S)-binding protein [Halobacteriovorax sp. HLS]|uniref:(2Fe-2S)-binding protein n=1 Tax=Halobacteriovorax sp. HLS TaxID=2234000 RepID=UPI0013E373E5|nr:(2Fe-2S)-binding protein [Halobacteriovorax sp. HLS]